jgi:hypothetical protein
MAVVNDRYGYVFLAEKHTASQAMRDALLSQPGSRPAGRHHARLKELWRKKYLQGHRHEGYLSFCVVRNPADVMVTRWLMDPDSNNTPFPRYIRQMLLNCPDPGKFFFQHAHSVNRVLRYEHLMDDLTRLMNGFGASVPVLTEVGKTPDKDYWDTYYISDDLVFMLENYPEVVKFGYGDTFRRNIRDKLRMEELTS